MRPEILTIVSKPYYELTEEDIRLLFEEQNRLAGEKKLLARPERFSRCGACRQRVYQQLKTIARNLLNPGAHAE